jgi:lipopolysaccharide transport system ATP-binding protein
MKQIVLDINDLGKSYQLGQIGLKSFSNKKSTDNLWALRNVSLKVNQGEVLGIIGENGAGKSTLLKLLSQITRPTEGSIKVRGKMASLLEVGTGMHPDLTGRENIYLNGAILGMTKNEIAEKFDEIVGFSGCEKFLDTPLKRYSTGMKVRLGFSVAAFLEPDIIIIDEVLAVGDAAFQAKAVEKILSLTRDEQRTVLFVSHNLAAVKSLCSRCIYLKKGEVTFDGDVNTGISKYLGYELGQDSDSREWAIESAPGNDLVKITKASILVNGEVAKGPFEVSQSFQVAVEVYNPEQIDLDCTMQLHNESGDFIAVTSTLQLANSNKKNATRMLFVLDVPPSVFNQKRYHVTAMIIRDRQSVVLRLPELFQLEFVESARNPNQWMGEVSSQLLPVLPWHITDLDS